jgi:uncharacterized delta-60 repeat protein
MTGFDLTFDGDGRVVTDLGGNDLLNQLEPLADGKILAIGQSFNGTNQGYVLIRYNSDGSLDNSFGTAGKSNTEIISLQTNVLIKPDGKIVIGGQERNGASSVYQYLPNGQIDSGCKDSGLRRNKGQTRWID